MPDIAESPNHPEHKHHKKFKACILLAYEDEHKRTICFESPVSIEVFMIAVVLAELERQENKNNELLH